MRTLAVLAVVTACGDSEGQVCAPPPDELPTGGRLIDPYALELPGACVHGGLEGLPGRWFVVDPTQYFRFEYPKYEGNCAQGFRRSFEAEDDHDASDSYTRYTWSDGTRFFQRVAYSYANTDYVRAFVTCMMPDDTLAAMYAFW